MRIERRKGKAGTMQIQKAAPYRHRPQMRKKEARRPPKLLLFWLAHSLAERERENVKKAIECKISFGMKGSRSS